MRQDALDLAWMMETEEAEQSSPDKVKLKRYISECGVASRRRAEALIERGRVEVNGSIVTDLNSKIIPQIDRVRVKGKLIQPVEKGIILLNKPEFVATTLDDPEGRPTVEGLLSKRYNSYFPVGGLDFESTGLVVMTNDGEVAQQLLHPKAGVERTYDVLCAGSVSYEIEREFERGIKVDDHLVRGDATVRDYGQDAAPEATWVQIAVSKVKSHELHRAFEKIGHPILQMHRFQYGPFRLGSIRLGEIRKLTEREYRQARSRVLRKVPCA